MPPDDGHQDPQAAAGGCCRRLGAVLALLPRCTLALLCLEVAAGLVLTVTGLAAGVRPSRWLALNMHRTYDGLELWRLVTAPLLPGTLFQALALALVGGSTAFALERTVGWRTFLALLLFAALGTALLASALTALVSLPPGLRDVGYLGSQWSSDAYMGPAPLLLFLTIMGIRLTGQRTFTCCFGCPVPAWAVILVTVVLAQLMLYPPWDGLPYTAAGVAVSYVLPRRAFMAALPSEAAPLLAADRPQTPERQVEPAPAEEFQGPARRL